MSTGSAPIKKKPLFFKRRAGPVPSTNPPTSFSNAPSSGLALDESDSDLSPTRPKHGADNTTNGASGVDLFRRAKHFYPKAIEDYLRDAGGQRQQQAGVEPTSPPMASLGRLGHDPKRRKVSHEKHAEAQDGVHDRSSITPMNSPPASPGLSRRETTSLSRTGSASPTPRATINKGKGIATSHNVNAQVVFTDSLSAPQPSSAAQDAEGDDSIIILEDDYSTRKVRKESGEAEDVKPHRALDIEEEDDGDIVEAIDPEFEEYIIRARARDAAARAAKAVQEVASELASGANVADGTTGTTGSTVPASQATTVSMARSTSTLSADVAQPSGDLNYRIFITPHLPEPVPPLIANVRMDQEMRHVKNAYLNHAREKGYPFSEEKAESVLLTWKGGKIYNWTTGASLKIKPDAKGRFRDDADGGILSRSSGYDQPPGFLSGGLHLEIWTEELYDQYQRDQEKRRRRNLGEVVEEDLVSSDDEGGEGAHGADAGNGQAGSGGAEDSTGAAAEQQRIRLVLKSRDYEKLNITAHGDTTVDTLIAAFRGQRQIEPDKTLAIIWEGDQLDGSTTVGEAEMEDMDSVEVHIH